MNYSINEKQIFLSFVYFEYSTVDCSLGLVKRAKTKEKLLYLSINNTIDGPFNVSEIMFLQ